MVNYKNYDIENKVTQAEQTLKTAITSINKLRVEIYTAEEQMSTLLRDLKEIAKIQEDEEKSAEELRIRVLKEKEKADEEDFISYHEQIGYKRSEYRTPVEHGKSQFRKD